MDNVADKQTQPDEDAPWSSLPTPVLEVLCAFLPTSDIKGLKLVCASFARRIGSSHAVRERLMYLPSRAMPVPLLPVSRNRSPQAPRSVR
jgi:hypothetical protein